MNPSPGLVMTAEPVAVRPARGAGDRAPRPRGVLVVDHNDAVRELLAAVVRGAGFAVWVASGGYEGVARYREHGSEIDVVILDVRMPEGDGPEALAAIHAITPGAPCFFMTGDPGSYSIEYLTGLGAAGVFLKPFRLDELVAHLRRVVAPPEPHDPAPVRALLGTAT